MRKWLRSQKERFGIPSGRAIIHVVVVQIAIQWIWNWVSKMFTIPLVREIGFLVVFIAGLFVVAWYLPRLAPILSGRSQPRKPNKSMLGEAPESLIKHPSASWLEQIVEDDKAHISNRIYARDYIWDFKKLTEPDPYLDLVFTLINAAMFAINIQGLTGRFLIEEHECAQPAELISTKRLPHGEYQNMRIRQRLTREMADLIINRRDLIPTSRMEAAKKGKVNISLKACQLLISSEIECESSKPIPFSIGGDYEVNIP